MEDEPYLCSMIERLRIRIRLRIFHTPRFPLLAQYSGTPRFPHSTFSASCAILRDSGSGTPALRHSSFSTRQECVSCILVVQYPRTWSLARKIWTVHRLQHSVWLRLKNPGGVHMNTTWLLFWFPVNNHITHTYRSKPKIAAFVRRALSIPLSLSFFVLENCADFFRVDGLSMFCG